MSKLITAQKMQKHEGKHVRLLHARIRRTQIDGLIIRLSRPSFCDFGVDNLKFDFQ